MCNNQNTTDYISVLVPMKPALKKYLLSRTKSTEPFYISKCDPLGFGSYVLNALSRKRSHFTMGRSNYKLTAYTENLTVYISPSNSKRTGLFLSSEKIKDINDFVSKIMYLECHSYIFGAKMFKADLVEKYALEDFRDLLRIDEDDLQLDSFFKEFSRKREFYSIR